VGDAGVRRGGSRARARGPARARAVRARPRALDPHPHATPPSEALSLQRNDCTTLRGRRLLRNRAALQALRRASALRLRPPPTPCAHRTRSARGSSSSATRPMAPPTASSARRSTWTRRRASGSRRRRATSIARSRGCAILIS
jgi:hypothetical protein